MREIDALDGLMGVVGDDAAIQFKVLNRSKGAAVQGPRIQADRDQYKLRMQEAIASQPNLSVVEASAQDLDLEGKGLVLPRIQQG